MGKYQQTIEAVQWTGYAESLQELLDFLPEKDKEITLTPNLLYIKRPSCNITLKQGQWLIKDATGTYYPMSHDEFIKLYKSIHLPF